MKKLLLSLSAAALVFAAPVTVPTAASAAPATDVVEFCKAFVAATTGVTLGDCVSYFRQDSNAAAATYCRILSAFDLLGDFGFKNVGQCVSTLKSY